jgi:hypothetical protein
MLITSNNNLTQKINHRLLLANKHYYGLKKQLGSHYLSLQTKCKLYKTLLRPIILYGSESRALMKTEENKLKISERKILRKIYGPISENGNWRSRYNYELYQPYEDSEIIKVIKAGRLRWLGHLYRANETDPCRKVTVTKTEGRREKGRPPIRWLDSVEQDLRLLGIQGWRNKARVKPMEKHSWGGQGL